MSLLLDTHILIWMVNRDAPGADRLSEAVLDDIRTSDTEVFFSVASVWEVAIKFARKSPEFTLSPQSLRRNLLDEAYVELGIGGDHAIAVGRLPPIHRDPFDRILVAQAQVEDLTLLTADETIARYPGPIRLV